MNCPNCNKISVCFCKSCKARRNMPRFRTEKAKGNYVMCPYCKVVFHSDAILDLERSERNKNNLDTMDGASGLVTKMLESKKSAP